LLANSRPIISLNPATLEELGRVPVSTDLQVQEAVGRARAAQPSLGSLSYKRRSGYLLRAKEVLLERQDEVCALIAQETGKPAMEALTSEVLPIANLIDYFVRKSEKLLRDEQFSLSVFRNKKSLIRYYPLSKMRRKR